MAIDERRRLALHRAAAGTWGQEVADTLVELVQPSDGEPITLGDLDQRFAAQDERWEARLDQRFAAQDERWEARFDQRFAAQDERWEARLDQRFAAQDERIDERFAAQNVRIDERFAAQDERLDAMEARWDARFAAQDARWDHRMESMEHRITATFERRLTDAVTLQTRTLVLSQLGAVVVIAGLAFGLQ